MSDSYFRRIYRPGSVVFREGERGDNAYIVERGRVEISARQEGGSMVLATIGPGEIFGEMAVIDEHARSATARTLEETELITVTREQLNERIDACNPIVSLLLKVVLERYRNRLRQMGGAPAEEVAVPTVPDMVANALHAQRQSALAKIKLENELNRALEAESFDLFYQPIVDLKSGFVAGFEALIRWNSPERGFVNPGEFISLSEETGLIVPIGLWVLREACSRLNQLQSAYSTACPEAPPLFMSVNVSRRQFVETDFIDEIGRIASATGIDPRMLKLEITEGLLIEDYKKATAWIEECKRMGLRIAVDDFGTGYSSLGYLYRFAVDTLKIDQSFVRSMLSNHRSMEIVRAVVGLARGLELDIIAEGIEGPEEMASLASMGCNFGQGYHFSKPVKLKDTLAFLGCAPRFHNL